MRLWLVLIFWFFAAPAFAHEVRPALLSIDRADQEFQVTWKQPITNGRRLKLTPVFPQGCIAGPALPTVDGQTIIERFSLACSLKTGVIRIEGLERTLTDVFIRIEGDDGSIRSTLVKPSNPVMDLTVEPPPAVRAYFLEGIWHILFGWDHLLFVIGLCFLVRRKQILGVATSFTLAHSLTLILSSMGVVSLPGRPVEILIAASILLLAVEVIRKGEGKVGLTATSPYVISFAIGLIHGLGFAGALADLGLPSGQELFALLLFNLGVEIGQFAVIGVALLVGLIVLKLMPKAARLGSTVCLYGIGTISAYWMIERLWGYSSILA